MSKCCDKYEPECISVDWDDYGSRKRRVFTMHCENCGFTWFEYGPWVPNE